VVKRCETTFKTFDKVFAKPISHKILQIQKPKIENFICPGVV